MPGVVIGHNQDIAWGMTNLGADVTDLYLEKVTATDYLYDGKQRPFKTRKETIKVAGGKDRDDHRAVETNNGPVISDRSGEIARASARTRPSTTPPRDRGDGYAVALRWTALDPRQDDGRGLRARHGARTSPQFRGRRATSPSPRRT